MIYRIVYIALIAAYSGISQANQLYKCLEHSQTSVQSMPCSASGKTLWLRSYTPELVLAVASQKQVKSGSVEYRYYRQPRRNSVRQYPKPETACQSANRRESEYRQKQGLSPKFNDLRRLSDAVYEACL